MKKLLEKLEKERFEHTRAVSAELSKILDRDLSVKVRGNFSGMEDYLVRAVEEAIRNVGVFAILAEEEKRLK